MTKYHFLGASLGALFLLGTTGCQSLVDDLNDDPNNFTNITLTLALNQAGLATASPSNQHTGRIATIFSDQFTGTDRQYVSLNAYSVIAGDFDATWEDIYQRGLPAAQIAKQKAQEQGLVSLEGAAQIFEAYYFGEAAALFGDVPFSQANRIEEFTDPSYEPQADVIAGAIALLDDAIGKVGDRAVSQDFGNIFASSSSYAGLANALKARYYLLLQDYPNALASAEASGWDSYDQSLKIITSTSNYGENLWWQFEVEQRSDYLSIGDSHFRQLLSDTTETSRMNDKTDDVARYDYFVAPGLIGGYIKYNTTDGFAAVDAPLEVITAREVQLILAESAARGGDEETAITALNTARNIWETILGTGDDTYQDYEAGDFAEGGISSDDNDSGLGGLVYSILQEKYVSVIGLPTYYDVLRTDNVIGAQVKSAKTTVIPQRFLYPSTERSSNESLGSEESLPGLYDKLPIFQ